jgi:hypothetical protein
MADFASVEFSLFTRNDFNSPNYWTEILSYLLQKTAPYSPEFVDYGKKWKNLTPSCISTLIPEFLGVRNFHFKRNSKYRSEISVLVHEQKSPSYNIFTMWVEDNFFQERVRIESFLATCIFMYTILQPFYGFIHQTDDKVKMTTIQHPHFGKTFLPIDFSKGLPGVYWGNFWGPPFVSQIGMEKLKLPPSYSTQVLDDGGILLLLDSSPLNYENASTRKSIKTLRNYLGDELFYPQ